MATVTILLVVALAVGVVVVIVVAAVPAPAACINDAAGLNTPPTDGRGGDGVDDVGGEEPRCKRMLLVLSPLPLPPPLQLPPCPTGIFSAVATAAAAAAAFDRALLARREPAVADAAAFAVAVAFRNAFNSVKPANATSNTTMSWIGTFRAVSTGVSRVQAVTPAV